MILITGTLRIPAGSIKTALPSMAAMIDASRAEDGCIAYSYALDVQDDGLVHIIEKWRDRAALNAHFNSAHLQHWRSQFARLGITDRDLTLDESIHSEPT